MQVPRAHDVTIEIRNQKEGEVTETWTNSFCVEVEVNIRSARVPASTARTMTAVGWPFPVSVGAALASG